MLANLKIRNKLLIALVPLGAMVLVGVSHSTFEMFRADNRYTAIIDDERQGAEKRRVARGLCHTISIWCCTGRSQRPIQAAMRQTTRTSIRSLPNFVRIWKKPSVNSPPGPGQIRNIAAEFDQGCLASREVRVAALKNDDKAAHRSDAAHRWIRDWTEPVRRWRTCSTRRTDPWTRSPTI